MNEFQLIQFLSKEGVTLVAIVLVYYLFVRPKDEQIKELVESNKQIVKENGEQLENIAETMEKISAELTHLNANQVKLKEGQDELWREIIQLKKER
jgi:predicted PurR-regulated permease PerM